MSSSKLADHFQKKQKTPQSTFQFGFSAPVGIPEEASTTEVSIKLKKKKKKKNATGNPDMTKTTNECDQPKLGNVVETTPQLSQEPIQLVTEVLDKIQVVEKSTKKKKKAKKKKKSQNSPQDIDATPKDFEFMFSFDKIGFSDAELEAMNGPSKSKSKKQTKKQPIRPPVPPTTPPPPPTGHTNYVTLRKATDNSSEVQKMQLRYGKGKRIHSTIPTKKKVDIKKEPSEFKFNF